MTNPAIQEGQHAPAFTLPTDGDGSVSLADFAGKPVVLYFYPKDSTPGCTTEACEFRDNLARVQATGGVVLGVSPDSIKSHDRFKAKQELNFPLLADTEHTVALAYGVWRKKKLYGREFDGIVRSTFLIDGDGVVRKVWDRVKVKGHVDAVLEALEAL